MPAPIPPYTLTRRRMKNIRMTVRAGTGEVRVSAPMRTPRRVIDDWVGSKSEWIEAQRAKALAVPAPLAPGAEADALRRELRPVIADLVAVWVPRMAVPQPTWRVRIMRSRWGSCNATARSLNFSLELARKDVRLVEYVVVHELAHLEHPNHGAGFHALMDRHLPDWRERRAALNGS